MAAAAAVDAGGEKLRKKNWPQRKVDAAVRNWFGYLPIPSEAKVTPT